MPGLTLLSLSMSTACHKITAGGTGTDEMFSLDLSDITLEADNLVM